MDQIIIAFVSQYPIGAAILIGIGVFRVLFKPTFAYLHQVVAATPSKKDDKALDNVEASKPYKALAFAVDYLLSIKLPGAEPQK